MSAYKQNNNIHNKPLSFFIVTSILLALSSYSNRLFVNCCNSRANHQLYRINGCEQLPCEPKNILTMTTAERQTFLNSFDIILSDIDGVLLMHSMFPGVSDVVNSFKKLGKRVVFVTNNSVRTAEAVKHQFKESDIDVEINDIFHPSRTTVDYLKKIKFEGLIYLVGSKIFKRALEEAGFSVIDGPNEILKESYTEMLKHIFSREPVKAVIMDTDFNVSGAKLIKAQLFLRDPECKLLVGATDKLLPVRPNTSVIGPGFFSEIVQNVTGREPIVIGKPGTGLCEVIEDQLQLKSAKRVLMIGDTFDQDVAFGKLCGYQTLLVFTGDAKLDDFKKRENAGKLPDYYASSLADMKIIFQNKL